MVVEPGLPGAYCPIPILPTPQYVALSNMVILGREGKEEGEGEKEQWQPLTNDVCNLGLYLFVDHRAQHQLWNSEEEYTGLWSETWVRAGEPITLSQFFQTTTL